MLRRYGLNRFAAALFAGTLPLATPALAQEEASSAVASWINVDLATGYETRGAPAVAAGLPGWEVDRWGNVVRTVGSGAPHRVLACGLDAPAYAASQITEDGYLRVHRIGWGSDHPLWDQQHEAKPVRILTRQGPVVGVVARTNGHFAWQHRGTTTVTTEDELWIDVGAESAEEVRAAGIELLDPIVRQLPPWVLEGGQVAGPAAGRRAGCAVAAALGMGDGPETGALTVILSSQTVFGWVGLASAVTRMEDVDEVVILGDGTAEGSDGTWSPGGGLGAALADRGLDRVHRIEPTVGNAGAHLEWIAPQEIRALRDRAAQASGVTRDDGRWVGAPAPAQPEHTLADPGEDEVASLLDDFVDLYGASGHEWAVRRDLLARMPAWARERAIVDGIGNVIVEMGPEGEATHFMAHLDEVGYQVTEVASDGVVTLESLGGALSTAWEGETALLHFDPEDAPSTAGGDGGDLDPRWKEQSLRPGDVPAPLKGLFLQRTAPERRSDDQPMKAVFGLSGDELLRLGVRPGLQVTMFKDGTRMGAHRFVARGLDDRVGTIALLRALERINPEALAHRIVFSWSVHEEGGLLGAEAIARRYGATARRIYSVDTFVSSDTPLESPHFAYAALGAGPVLRAIESSGASPVSERDRVRRIAEGAGIPLQIGLTQGGTDGTRFTFRGAPNQGLSWPGRYSHSPGEVLDLRDVNRLVELIVNVANEGG
jgi:putative aminopeptidase FrvX